jgi:hypothetical protein
MSVDVAQLGCAAILPGAIRMTLDQGDLAAFRRKMRSRWRRLTWSLRVGAVVLIVWVVLPTIGTAAFNPWLLGAWLLMGLAPDIANLIEWVNSGRRL